MPDDDRTTLPPKAGLPDEGADLGGIPSTLNQGVDHASDRSSGRREGALESDAGGVPPSLPVSPESAAIAPRPARDLTGTGASAAGAPASGHDAARGSEAGSAGPNSGGGSSGGPNSRGGDTAAGNDAAGSKAGRDDAGQDDSLPESLGKAIAEPFKSD